MSLAELLAHIQTLPRADKACLLKTLIDNLIKENNDLAEVNAVWELRRSPEVAQALQQILQANSNLGISNDTA